jgi:hypothetical protein
MHGYISPNELKLVPPTRVSPEDLAKGAMPGWPNITDDLIAKGLISKDEVPPNLSIPSIAKKMRAMEVAANKAKLTGGTAGTATEAPAPVSAEAALKDAAVRRARKTTANKAKLKGEPVPP